MVKSTRRPPEGQENPFEFGGELRTGELVDRTEELDLICRTLRSGGKLFLIGPRRYGKTSLLRVAERELTSAKASPQLVVLRFDAEAYETIDGVAQAILGAAAQRLTGTLEKAGQTITQLFGRLRPDVSYDLAEQKVSVRFGVVPAAEAGRVPVLTEVLHGVERLAKESGKRVALMLDEFQQIVEEGGETAERQLRAAVQTHRHVAYAFAGSRTRLLAEMTNDPARAFWKLGTRLFLGPIPRPEFLAFLDRGFRLLGAQVDADALQHLLGLAEDVPYNVQQLAHVTWEMLRVAPTKHVTTTIVDDALTRLVAREYPSYAQLWNNLTKTQKLVLRAVIAKEGAELASAAVTTEYGLAPSTIHKTLRLLDDRGIIRQEEGFERSRFRLEDPFLAAWLERAQAGVV